MPIPETLTTASHGDLDLRLAHGAWPADLAGDVLFSAPMISGGSPSAIFDLGCIIRLSLTAGTHGAAPDRFAWRTRAIESPSKRIHDRAPDAFVATTVGHRSSFGPLNAANTAPLPWGDRLFVTWDAGRPVELHPGTLDFVAEVGSIDSWGPSMMGDTVLPTILTSAHPVTDRARGGMWTTKLDPVLEPTFAMAPSVVFWRPDRTDVSVWPIEGIAFNGSTHTVSHTRDWVILCDSGNFRADLGEMMGGERTVTVDDDAPVWLLRKDQVLSTPPGTPVRPVCLRVAPPNGHFYARYDDADGISMVWEGMDLLDLGLAHRADDVDLLGRPMPPTAIGLYNMAMARSTLNEIVIDPNRGVVADQVRHSDDWTFNLQLSAMDWSPAGQAAPTAHHVTYQGCRPGNVSERAAQLYRGRIERSQLTEETPASLATFRRGGLEVISRWEYGDVGDLPTSPTFVPRSGSAAGGDPGGHDGYVVQPVFNDGGFRVELFDAARVGAGPIATLRAAANECVPLMLHSAWMPTTTELVDAPRLSFADDVTDARLAGLDRPERRVVASVAEELG